MYTDYLWFGSIDQQGVFTTILWSKVTAGVITTLVVSAVLYVNVAYADKAADGHTSMRLRDAEGIAQVDLGEVLPRLLRIGTIIVGLLTGLAASEYWDEYLLWQNASDFGIDDPVFGRDVSFYVFTLPLLEAVHGG